MGEFETERHYFQESCISALRRGSEVFIPLDSVARGMGYRDRERAMDFWMDRVPMAARRVRPYQMGSVTCGRAIDREGLTLLVAVMGTEKARRFLRWAEVAVFSKAPRRAAGIF